MSREVDVSNPEQLSDEDRAYLRARGRVDVVQELDRLAAVNGMAAVPGRYEAMTAESVRERRARGLMKPVPPAVADPRNVEEVPPYDQWSRDDLVVELKARGLPTTGKNAEFVERLEANDREVEKH